MAVERVNDTQGVVGPPAAGSVSASIPMAPPEMRDPSGRILVVDDEELVRNIIEHILAGFHEVVAVSSGRAAQDLLGGDTSFDLVLCDVMMPEMLGIDLHAWLTEHHPGLVPRLAFISGGAFSPRTSDYLARVSSPMIRKPFDATAFRRRVDELVAVARGNGV